MDQPVGKHIDVAWLTNELQKFEGNLIIQTMFLRGEYQGEKIDNTTDLEIDTWIGALQKIQPKQVMIYSLDRSTPVEQLQKVNVDELNDFAERVKAIGIEVSVAG